MTLRIPPMTIANIARFGSSSARRIALAIKEKKLMIVAENMIHEHVAAVAVVRPAQIVRKISLENTNRGWNREKRGET